MIEPAASRGFVSEALTRALAPHRPALALLLLTGLLFLPAIWTRDVWNPDEPKYAEVTREMVSSGDYLVPHLNAEIYAEKPPLFFWLGIVAEWLPLVPEGAGPRLVAVAATFGTLLLTFGLGRDLANPRVGWLAAVLLATSSMFTQHASAGVIDPLLTFLTTAAIRCGLAARAKESTTLWAGFYGLGGLAILAKGPVGIIVPAGTLILLALTGPERRRFFSRHVLWGIALMAAMVAAWLAPAIARGGAEYGRIILFRQNIGRAWNSWHHRESYAYFFKVFPALFLPWFLFLPGALLGAFRRIRPSPGVRNDGRDGDGRDAVRVALAWFAFTFIFFTLMSGKKSRYLLPLFPAATLLVALDIESRILSVEGGRRTHGDHLWLIPAGACSALLILIGIAAAAAGMGAASGAIARIDGLAPDQLDSLLWLGQPPGGLLLVAAGGIVAALGMASLSMVKRRPRSSAALLIAGWLVLVGAGQWIATPSINALKSARPLAEAALTAAGKDGAIASYRASYPGGLNLALRRDRIERLNEPAQVAAWRVLHPRGVVVTSERDLASLAIEIPGLRMMTCRRLSEERACVAVFD